MSSSRFIVALHTSTNVYIKNAAGQISVTMDLWTDPNLAPFMAITAHWIELKPAPSGIGPSTLILRTELIGFKRVPSPHTGEHLAHAFLWVLRRIGIAKKVRVTFSGVSFILIELRLGSDRVDHC